MFKTVVSILAREIAKEIIVLVRDNLNFQHQLNERDQKAIELKNDIKIAKTQEERDALLDKMDELLRSSLR